MQTSKIVLYVTWLGNTVHLLALNALMFIAILPIYGSAQTIQASNPNLLDSVTIYNSAAQDIQRLKSFHNTYIVLGKKNEVIELSKKDHSISEKYGRQVFAKIPGVFVYDMDGTGNQLNISVRGLDAHRGWELNSRKDGVITNSDLYGYPGSHYSIPLEAVDRIELIRGTGSLQYGAQFGGMINYVSKAPDTLRKFNFESIHSIGSYQLLSNFIRVSGKINRFRYLAWGSNKLLSGYRANSNSTNEAQGLSLFYNPTPAVQLKFDWTHSRYITQLAGPLTDAQFLENPQMATRARNYYSPNIHIPSVTLDWKFGTQTKLNFISSAVLGDRSSVLFDKPANVVDAIDPLTLDYANRQVDIDQYASFTNELRIKHHYKMAGQTHTFCSGIQYLNNDLHRQQQGKGTTGTDFDLTLVTPGWGRDLHFKTKNIALFLENNWSLSTRFSMNTGLRFEQGDTEMTGVTTYATEADLQTNIAHKFPLLGISAQYDLSATNNLYSGWSQGYRPVIFKDIIPASIYESTNKNIKDASGYNADFGYRGKWRMLKWDVSLFYLQYNNRLGSIAITDAAGNYTSYRTNIGNSHTKGLEVFFQKGIHVVNNTYLTVYTATSYMEARYENAVIRTGTQNTNVSNNHVESVPKWISRNGISINTAKGSMSLLYSYTAETFADALNTVTPSATGATGIVPSYQLVDLNATIPLSTEIKAQLNINNLLDKSYFTKRPQFYPGPGIWPSDGRTISGTIFVTIH
jgi:Fe(3+) dicitrate transport protein